jgi:hypothetical protein
MREKKNTKKCYNCDNSGVTREHIIPKFILQKGEVGFFIPCCEMCRSKLKWLDDYGADFFRYWKSHNSYEEWERWYKQAIIQNGSPLALRLFGEDVVTDEVILMNFIHKICVGVAYKLYGRLDDAYRITVFTNFSMLGNYCQYNDPNELSFSEEQTSKILKYRDVYFNNIIQMLEPYNISMYEIKNAKLAHTANQVINGALWFSLSLFDKYKIICAVVDGVSPEFVKTRNMIFSSLPVRIDLCELGQLYDKTIKTKRGDSIVTNLANSPISSESRALRKAELGALGVLPLDIETFENSLADFLQNKGGKEELSKRFLDAIKSKNGHLSYIRGE